MARTVRDAKLDTRSARARLKMRHAPYWTTITRGNALGYRKGVKGGIWLAKFRDDSGNRHQQTLASADDARDPDGINVLSFAQAQAKARDWIERKERELLGEPLLTGPYTVQDAMVDYLDWYGKHRKAVDRTKYAVDAFILPRLGSIEANRLR